MVKTIVLWLSGIHIFASHFTHSLQPRDPARVNPSVTLVEIKCLEPEVRHQYDRKFSERQVVETVFTLSTVRNPGPPQQHKVTLHNLPNI